MEKNDEKTIEDAFEEIDSLRKAIKYLGILIGMLLILFIYYFSH